MNNGFKYFSQCFNKIIIITSLLAIFTPVAIAVGGGISLGAAADNVTIFTGYVAQLFTAIMLVIGVGFVVGSLIKYKAYRENPQYIPLSTPVILFFIGVTFLLLALLLSYTGETIFNPNA